MIVNKSSEKIYGNIKILKSEKFKKIIQEINSGEYFENKWFYMKYIR